MTTPDPKTAVEGLEHVLMLIDREDDIHIDRAITCIEKQAEEIERYRKALDEVINGEVMGFEAEDIARAALADKDGQGTAEKDTDRSVDFRD